LPLGVLTRYRSTLTCPRFGRSPLRPRCLFAPLLLIGAIALFSRHLDAQTLVVSPSGYGWGTSGGYFTITVGLNGSLPPGAYVDNYVIYVKNPGQSYTPHSGSSYTIGPTPNPSEYIYYATAVKHFMGQSFPMTSATADRAFTNLYALTVTYNGDCPLYTRQSQQDVPEPQWTGASPSWPACYVVGNSVSAAFTTAGSGNNGVNLLFRVRCDLLKQTLVSEGAPGWPYDSGWQPYTAGSGTFGTPALPAYVYKHYLDVTLNWGLQFATGNDPPISVVQQHFVTPVEAVFADPNGTFPPYHYADDPANHPATQNKPWYEIIDCALCHVTQGGTNLTVTDRATAMRNLTTDLYVWPTGSWGPGSSKYNPSQPNFYLYHAAQGEIRYDLWGMAQNSNGDCQDFAAYLECQADSLGIGGVAKERLGQPYGSIPVYDPGTGEWDMHGGDFYTNPAVPCGTDASTYLLALANSQYYGFSFHQMTCWSNGIYDWAVAYPYSIPIPWFLALGASLAQMYNPPTGPDVLFGSIGTPGYPPAWSPAFALGGSDPCRWDYVTGTQFSVPTLLGSY
jgi:hypothetical protein